MICISVGITIILFDSDLQGDMNLSEYSPVQSPPLRLRVTFHAGSDLSFPRCIARPAAPSRARRMSIADRAERYRGCGHGSHADGTRRGRLSEALHQLRCAPDRRFSRADPARWCPATIVPSPSPIPSAVCPNRPRLIIPSGRPSPKPAKPACSPWQAYSNTHGAAAA